MYPVMVPSLIRSTASLTTNKAVFFSVSFFVVYLKNRGAWPKKAAPVLPGAFHDIIRPSSEACCPLKHYFEVNRYSNCCVQAT